MIQTYRGYRDDRGAHVTVSVPFHGHQPLPQVQDLRNHSPTGFEWGYGGSGPAQLALAILADATQDDELAECLHQHFKREVVANLPRGGWELTIDEVRAWLYTVPRHLADILDKEPLDGEEPAK